MPLEMYNPKLFNSACPTCGSINDGATQAGGDATKQPQPNDLSVCAYCAAVCVYNVDLTLRLATADDLIEAGASDPFAMRMIYQIRLFVRERNHKGETTVQEKKKHA